MLLLNISWYCFSLFLSAFWNVFLFSKFLCQHSFSFRIQSNIFYLYCCIHVVHLKHNQTKKTGLFKKKIDLKCNIMTANVHDPLKVRNLFLFVWMCTINKNHFKTSAFWVFMILIRWRHIFFCIWKFSDLDFS